MTLEINLPEPLREWQESIVDELRRLEDERAAQETAVLAAEEAAAAARDQVTAIVRLIGREPWPAAIAGRIVELRQRVAAAEQQAVQARHERDRHQKTIADRADAMATLDAARDRHEAAIRASAPPPDDGAGASAPRRSGAGLAPVVRLGAR